MKLIAPKKYILIEFICTPTDANFSSVKIFRYVFNNANWAKFGNLVNLHLAGIDDIDRLINNLNKANCWAKAGNIPKKAVYCHTKSLHKISTALIIRRNRHRRNWLRNRNKAELVLVKWLSQVIMSKMFILRNENCKNLLATLEVNSSPFGKLSKVIKKKRFS